MTEDNLLQGSSRPSGRLAAYTQAKNDTRFQQSSGEGPWSKIITARHSTYEFYIRKGENRRVVFLTDATPLPLYKVARSKPAQRSFPSYDYVRSPSVEWDEKSGSWVNNGKLDPFGLVLQTEPSLCVAAYILDLTPVKNKDDVVIAYSSLRLLVVDRAQISAQLVEASSIAGEPLDMSLFRVSRSNQEKSINIGDAWVREKKVSLESLLNAKVPETKEPAIDPKLAKLIPTLDIMSAFPICTNEEAYRILANHARIINTMDGGSRFRIDSDALEKLREGKLVSPGDDLGSILLDSAPTEETRPARKSGPSLLASLGDDEGDDDFKV